MSDMSRIHQISLVLKISIFFASSSFSLDPAIETYFACAAGFYYGYVIRLTEKWETKIIAFSSTPTPLSHPLRKAYKNFGSIIQFNKEKSYLSLQYSVT